MSDTQKYRKSFEEELKKLPAKPGVYIMHDAKDTIIYVGKAINLRNRVRSYFRESTKKSPKIQRMVSFISRFEFFIKSVIISQFTACSGKRQICLKLIGSI